VEARDPKSHASKSGLQLSARLSPVFGESTTDVAAALLPVEPGTYEGEIALPEREASASDERGAIHRLDLLSDDRVARTRFVSVPYPREYCRFGTDRVALADLVQRAGGRSRMLDVPDNLNGWLKEIEAQRAYVSARPFLIVLAALCLLAELAIRGLRRR
jgi:hypothetical protein